MSSAVALPLLPSARSESSPPRATTLGSRTPLASVCRATPTLPSSAPRHEPGHNCRSGPKSGVVARLQPVPPAPSVAALHIAGVPRPANAVSPDDSPGPCAAELETELIAMLPALERRAYRWCRDPAEAQDLAQDTVLRALGKKPTFDSQSHLRAWLYTVLRNLFISRRRRDQSWQRASGELTGTAERASDAPVPFLTASIERALARLPEAFARVVHLVDLEDYSYADAASMLGVPVGTVMSRLFRARQRLALELPSLV